MEDENIFAPLIARTALAERALSHPHNHGRYRAPFRMNDALHSRESTPLLDKEEDDAH